MSKIKNWWDGDVYVYEGEKIDEFYEFSERGRRLTKLRVNTTAVHDFAFQKCGEYLRTVELLPTLTTIGDGAFSRCVALESIDLPASVTKIGSYAFFQCSALKAVNIPEDSRLWNIGVGAFGHCYSLPSIDLSNLASLRWISRATFARCKSLTTVHLPTAPTALFRRISSEAFHGCTSLRQVDLPYTLRYVDGDPFAGCTSLINSSSPSMHSFDSMEFFCDVNRWGRQFLLNRSEDKAYPAALWPIILSSVVSGSTRVDKRRAYLGPISNGRRRKVLYYLLIHGVAADLA